MHDRLHLSEIRTSHRLADDIGCFPLRQLFRFQIRKTFHMKLNGEAFYIQAKSLLCICKLLLSRWTTKTRVKAFETRSDGKEIICADMTMPKIKMHILALNDFYILPKICILPATQIVISCAFSTTSMRQHFYATVLLPYFHLP